VKKFNRYGAVNNIYYFSDVSHHHFHVGSFRREGLIPYIQIDKDLTIFDFIIITIFIVLDISYSFELFKNRILIIVKMLRIIQCNGLFYCDVISQ